MTDLSIQPPVFFESHKKLIDHTLTQVISQLAGDSSTLAKAIHYSTLLGGKRIRPILVLATAECFGIEPQNALTPACAVELIHAYSLIHDDLPAMDNDDLRRGHATCHRAFNEATAILAGDALQAMAFELIAQEATLPSQSRLHMIQTLARASGPRGMVLGQAIDFESVGKQLDLHQLEHMHLHKTGAIIEASALLGALCQGTTDPAELQAISTYARAIGLAFQVQDDILDVVSDTLILGKKQGADAALNKPTYPSLLGLEGAKDKLALLHQEALTALRCLPGRDTRKLAEISHFIISRQG